MSRIAPSNIGIPLFKNPKKKVKGIGKGKKGKADAKNVRYLKKLFEAKGYTHCLLNYEGCWREVHGFAHATRRRFINTDEMLRCAIPACNECHRQLDLKSHDETEQIVKKIRAECGL
jgi:hypothetical protein